MFTCQCVYRQITRFLPVKGFKDTHKQILPVNQCLETLHVVAVGGSVQCRGPPLHGCVDVTSGLDECPADGGITSAGAPVQGGGPVLVAAVDVHFALRQQRHDLRVVAVLGRRDELRGHAGLMVHATTAGGRGHQY